MSKDKSFTVCWPLIRLLLLAMLGMIAIGRVYKHWPSFWLCLYMIPTVSTLLFFSLYQIYVVLRPNTLAYFGSWLISAIGIAMNFSVLLVNKGMMPAANAQTVQGFHIPFNRAKGFLCLADRIGHTYALSVGDIFIFVGAGACMGVAMWALITKGLRILREEG